MDKKYIDHIIRLGGGFIIAGIALSMLSGMINNQNERLNAQTKTLNVISETLVSMNSTINDTKDQHKEVIKVLSDIERRININGYGK